MHLKSRTYTPQSISSTEAVLRFMENWCAYQERSQDEARRKLASLNVRGEDAEVIIAQLISDNFLNEERFAQAFAGGKFRIKKWGRIKIMAELRKHKIPEPLISQALAQIPDNDYETTIRTFLSRCGFSKDCTVREKLKFRNKAVMKGFEADVISKIMLLEESDAYES